MNNREIIEINGGGYRALINLSEGANCICLENFALGADILRQPDYSVGIDNPFLYGMPILYPVNRISNGRFTFEGRTYTFPVNEPQTQCHLHGTLHETQFDLADRGENFVTCVFDRPYLDFPHRFRLEITYRLSEGGMEQTVRIENLSTQNMPNFLGFHTTFCVPFLEGAQAEDVRVFAEIGEEIERDTAYLPTGNLLSPDDVCRAFNAGIFSPQQMSLSRNCKAIKNGRIELWDIKRKVALVYNTDRQFPFRLFYGQREGYICLEPMTCIANCQNSPLPREIAGFDSISPHGERIYLSRIYLKSMES